MHVIILNEAGFDEAMFGLSLSYNQPIEGMPLVADGLVGKGDSHAKLLKYAQSKGIPMSEIIADFIDKGVDHDIFDGDWGEKLKRYEEKVNAYANLDKSCAALAF